MFLFHWHIVHNKIIKIKIKKIAGKEMKEKKSQRHLKNCKKIQFIV